MRAVIKYIWIAYLLQSAVLFLFIYRSPGLIYDDGQKTGYVNELQSSGSDDDIAIVVMTVISVIMLLIFAFKRYQPSTTLSLVICSTALKVLASFLMEMGSIYMTIVRGGDILMIVAFLIECVTLIFATINYINPRQSLSMNSRNHE